MQPDSANAIQQITTPRFTAELPASKSPRPYGRRCGRMSKDDARQFADTHRFLIRLGLIILLAALVAERLNTRCGGWSRPVASVGAR